MAHQFKAGMRPQMMHVVSRPGVEIIDAQDFVAAFQQAIAKVRSNKSGSAGDEDATFGQHGQSPPGVAGGESIIGVSLVPNLGVASRHATRSSLQPSNWAHRFVNQSATAVSWSHTTLASRGSPGT